MLPLLKSTAAKGASKQGALDEEHQPNPLYHLRPASIPEEGSIKQVPASCTLNAHKALSPYLAPKPKHEARTYPSVCLKPSTRRSKLPSVDAANHAACHVDEDKLRREPGHGLSPSVHSLPKADSLPVNTASASSSMALPSVYTSVYRPHAIIGTGLPARRRTRLSVPGDDRLFTRRPPWQSVSGTGDSLWAPSRQAAGHACKPLATQSHPVLRVKKIPSPFRDAAQGSHHPVPAPAPRLWESLTSGQAPAISVLMESHGSAPGDLGGLLQRQEGNASELCSKLGGDLALVVQGLEQQIISAATQQNPKITFKNQEGGRLPALPSPQTILASWLSPAVEPGCKPAAAPATTAASQGGSAAPTRSPLYNRRLSDSCGYAPSAPAPDSNAALPAPHVPFKRVWSAEDSTAASGPSAGTGAGQGEVLGSRCLGRTLAFRRRAGQEEAEALREQGSGHGVKEQETESSSSGDEEPPGNRFLGRAIAFRRRAEPELAEEASTLSSSSSSLLSPRRSNSLGIRESWGSTDGNMRAGPGLVHKQGGEGLPEESFDNYSKGGALEQSSDESMVEGRSSCSSSASSHAPAPAAAPAQAQANAHGAGDSGSDSDSVLNDVTRDGVRTLGQKYVMQSVLGEGSYGMVFRCTVADGSGRQVAIKSFKIEENNQQDATSIKRISKREVAMLRALQHPHVVGYEDAFYARDRLFIVMEYVPDTLLTLLEAQPEGMEGHAVRPLVRQLCSAMAFIHSKNAIYRDIKPENMLIDKHKTLKLCDFGFARFMNAPGEKLTDYVATRWYRAPELLLGPPYLSGSETVQYMYGPPTDMWAIGCLMAEMLTGQPLFPGDSDIDQLHLIQQLRGPLIPEHQALFDRNPHNAGAKLAPGEAASLALAKRFGGKISRLELDFLSGLLCMDPQRRLTGPQCLQHPYLAG